MAETSFSRPGRRLALAEAPRALAEFSSLFSTGPLLTLAPRGEPHRVIVMPGFAGSDRSTTVLREYLSFLGYDARPWQLGRNLGPATPDLLPRLGALLNENYASAGDKVSLVGWSLGGVYARLLAHVAPSMVRQVITLGSPFAGNPKSTRAYRVVQSLSDEPLDQGRIHELRLTAGDPLPGVPSTAIFSKTDGVVPWQIAVERPSPSAENVEVYSSHIGLGVNPAVLYAVADRLAQPARDWQAFERDGWKSVVYGSADLEGLH